MTAANHAKDLVNGGVRWQRAVQDGELAFQTLWDVITASSWLDHGSQELIECE